MEQYSCTQMNKLSIQTHSHSLQQAQRANLSEGAPLFFEYALRLLCPLWQHPGKIKSLGTETGVCSRFIANSHMAAHKPPI